MSVVRSAAGFVEISVRVDSDGDPWIGSNTKGEGCFSDEAVERLINELADAIGKNVTLEDKPKPPVNRFPKIGTVIRSKSGFLYTRISDTKWLSNFTGAEYTNEQVFSGVALNDPNYHEEVN